ncbi:LuxR C-terminal-related transcriptional regulator [Cohnella sp. WQ 127256]|uniref:LuxR C-terminal-related transcriptional regulator n=1 Tax=Cohnella sp. WQ 127256 TaxID=2938790 RepID=UPI002118B7CC|nr:LuxR C-terminal-related transcriptional regulator [Cohnella sp. WQ 127256]
MIVSTKLYIPHVRNSLVSRPRLISMLNEGLDAKLTLVSAQAGYGKTTALSDWVKQCRAPVAWVSLDKLDDDWIQFWSYVIASIRMRVPGFGKTVETLLEKGPSVHYEPIITSLLNELNSLTSELVLILDDFHSIELPTIFHSLSYLLEHLPLHIHLYIASRTDLAIPTARLLAKGELHIINMHDLRFQLEEGVAFFRDTMGLLLTKEQVTELFNRIEGWVSGLQLAAISLKQSDNLTESIHRFSGQHHHISDYLLEEVFYHQSEQIKAFLLETSILGRMNRSLCQAVTGQMNCQEQLERLEQLNLFIIPLDDNRSWYRYHHLLSDFLQQMLFRSDSVKWKQVHISAANWLETHGFDEEAVEHYIEGKRYEDAVRLIEKNLQFLMQSKTVILNRWVSVIPEDAFAKKPMVEMLYISVLLGVGKWEAAFGRAEQAKVRFQALQGKMSDEEWNKTMGNIYFFCSISSYLRKDLVRTSEHFEGVERYMPDGSFFQTMGRNRYQGYDAFDDHLAFINDLHAADVFLAKWIHIWGKKSIYPFIGSICASYSKLLYEWNRLEEAELCINQVLGRNDMQPFARTLIHIAISASRIQQAKGNSKRASELLVQLKLQIYSPDYALFMLNIEAEQACLSLRQGSNQDALDWLERCGLTHKDEVSLFRMAEYLSLARVLAGCGRMEEALHLLEKLYLLLCKEDRLRDRIKVLIMQSVTLQQAGQTEAALEQLEIALLLAEPEGYIRSFIDEGSIMAEMLISYLGVRRVSRLGYTSSVSLTYVKQLLQALNVTLEDGLSLKEILTEQETRILGLIASGMSNKEIAQHLIITTETVKSHIKNIYRKLSASNRVNALQRANELNFLG